MKWKTLHKVYKYLFLLESKKLEKIFFFLFINKEIKFFTKEEKKPKLKLILTNYQYNLIYIISLAIKNIDEFKWNDIKYYSA